MNMQILMLTAQRCHLRVDVAAVGTGEDRHVIASDVVAQYDQNLQEMTKKDFNLVTSLAISWMLEAGLSLCRTA